MKEVQMQECTPMYSEEDARRLIDVTWSVAVLSGDIEDIVDYIDRCCSKYNFPDEIKAQLLIKLFMSL